MTLSFLLEIDQRRLRKERDGFVSILSNSIKNNHLGLIVTVYM
jgi:hypothetical protein